MVKILKIYKFLLTVFIIFVLGRVIFFGLSSPVSAHPGNVSSDGCHFCRTNCSSWGFTYFTRHSWPNPNNTCSCLGLKDPLYCPSTQLLPNPFVCPALDDYQSQFQNIPNSDGRTYTINMTWSNNIKGTGYSLSLDNYQNSDPGPLSDTSNNYFSFNNVLPGSHYVHLKVGINYSWCQSVNWLINVPSWTPPVPTPLISTNTNQSGSNNNWFWFLIGLGIVGFIAWGIIKSKQTNKTDQI